MANCTDAQGTFTFNTDFYNKHEALLEDYFDHDKQYQGGIIDEHYADQTCLNDWYKNDLYKAFEK